MLTMILPTNRITRTLLQAVLLTGLCGGVSPESYYVALDGDDGNVGTLEAPWGNNTESGRHDCAWRYRPGPWWRL